MVWGVESSPKPSSNNNKNDPISAAIGVTPPRSQLLANKVAVAKESLLQSANSPQPLKGDRPSGSRPHQAELEALRQRGLAKLLNKHFTETAQKLAAEKAAVDSALRDLEERKKREASHRITTTIPLSPNANTSNQIDDMYHRINRMRAECRQKEKETLLLYQRYVHKFGFTGHIKAPTETKTDTQLQVDVQASLALPTLESSPLDSPNSLSPAGTNNTNDSTEDTGQSTLLKSPSSEQPTVVQTLEPNEETPDDPLQEQKDLQQSKENGMDETKLDLVRMLDNNRSPSQSMVLGGLRLTPSGDDEDKEDVALLSKYFDLEKVQSFSPSKDDDDDLSSLISGLTSVDSATTRQILLDCEMTVATFLDEERRAIQKIIGEDSHSLPLSPTQDPLLPPTGGNASTDGSYDNSIGPSPSAEGVLEAESMAKQMQQILLEFQNQTQQTTPSAVATSLAGDSMLTNATSMSPETTSNSSSTKPPPRPYPTSNMDEEWEALWDENYQREYYHEKRSGQTQWHPPDDDVTSTANTSALDPNDVIPEVAENSRIHKYRAKQRRRRRRQRMVRVAIVVFMAVFMGAIYQFYQWRKRPAAEKAQVSSPPETDEQRDPQKEPEHGTEATTSFNEDTAVEEEVVDSPLESVVESGLSHSSSSNFSSDSITTTALDQSLGNREPRPMGCNIPLSYLVSRKCRILAREQPMFDLHEIVQTMMQ